MEPTRAVARDLARDGLLEFTQKGAAVDPFSHRGPVRLRLKENHEADETAVSSPENVTVKHEGSSKRGIGERTKLSQNR